MAPLLRISPYPAGLRAIRPTGGLSRQRRCNLTRTKAAADGGWRGLPPTFPPSSGISAALPMPYGGTGVNFVILSSLKSDCEATLFSSTQDRVHLKLMTLPFRVGCKAEMPLDSGGRIGHSWWRDSCTKFPLFTNALQFFRTLFKIFPPGCSTISSDDDSCFKNVFFSSLFQRQNPRGPRPADFVCSDGSLFLPFSLY